MDYIPVCKVLNHFIVVDYDNTFIAAICAHNWLIEPSNGPESEVKCQRGTLDSLFKEMVFVAVSASNGCEYCLRCHTEAARKQGMTDEMLGELIAVVNVATQSNILANGYQIPLDDDLKD